MAMYIHIPWIVEHAVVLIVGCVHLVACVAVCTATYLATYVIVSLAAAVDWLVGSVSGFGGFAGSAAGSAQGTAVQAGDSLCIEGSAVSGQGDVEFAANADWFQPRAAKRGYETTSLPSLPSSLGNEEMELPNEEVQAQVPTNLDSGNSDVAEMSALIKGLSVSKQEEHTPLQLPPSTTYAPERWMLSLRGSPPTRDLLSAGSFAAT